MATGITLILVGWGIGLAPFIAIFAAQWWHRRNLPDEVLFPELQATTPPRSTKRKDAA